MSLKRSIAEPDVPIISDAARKPKHRKLNDDQDEQESIPSPHSADGASLSLFQAFDRLSDLKQQDELRVIAWRPASKSTLRMETACGSAESCEKDDVENADKSTALPPAISRETQDPGSYDDEVPIVASTIVPPTLPKRPDFAIPNSSQSGSRLAMANKGSDLACNNSHWTPPTAPRRERQRQILAEQDLAPTSATTTPFRPRHSQRAVVASSGLISTSARIPPTSLDYTSHRQVNELRRTLHNVLPIDHSDYGRAYRFAHESIPTTAAYCGFRTTRNMFRYLLSPAFLQAFLKFAAMMQDREWEMPPTFKSAMPYIDAHRQASSDFRFSLSLRQAYEEYAAESKSDISLDKMKAPIKLLAYCLYWTVHKGPEQLGLPVHQQEEQRIRQKQKAGELLGRIPDLDLSEAISIPRLRTGEVFTHDHDRHYAERYNRVYQMVLLLWRTFSAQRQKQDRKADWEAFWRRDDLFQQHRIDPQLYAPLWMRVFSRGQKPKPKSAVEHPKTGLWGRKR